MASANPLQNIADHPSTYIAPLLLGTIFEAFEMGLIFSQFCSFLAHAREEKLVVRVIVVFVFLVGCSQFVASMCGTWQVHVIHFGDYSEVLNPNWAEKSQTTINKAMAAPVQAFLLYHCWRLTKQKTRILVPLLVIYITSLFFSIYTTARVFQLNFSTPTSDIGPPQPIPIDPYFLTAVISTATLDILISTILVYFFLSSRSNTASRRFKHGLVQLCVVSWRATVPPTVCAIALVATSVQAGDSSFWDLFCQAILGKLYVISLFTTLNGYHSFRHQDKTISPSTVLDNWALTNTTMRVTGGTSGDNSGDSNSMSDIPTTSSGLGVTKFTRSLPPATTANTSYNNVYSQSRSMGTVTV